MLSILIPVYNFDVRELVEELSHQASLLEIDCEIICLDDASEISWQNINEELKSFENVIYQSLDKNVGRAHIRNLLADKARFEYLLFLDCDSKTQTSYYLKNYVNRLPTHSVLYGGRTYQEEKPTDNTLWFHWWYGINREQMSVEARSKKPHHGFMTNNFLIPKKLFNQIRFDESLRQYGHEDTLFGWQLKKNGINVEHLDNPLIHIGLEKNEMFIDKSIQAIENLTILLKQYPELDTRLIATWQQLKKYQLASLVSILLKPLRPFIIKNLKGSKPQLKGFDLLKLSYFLELY